MIAYYVVVWGIESLNAPRTFQVWGTEVYAIVRAGGKQYRVSPDDVISIDRLAAQEGDDISLDQVLLVSGDKGLKVGAPYVTGAKVTGKVVQHLKGRKIRGFTFKPKKDVRRRYGHRQHLTSVLITDIKAGK